MTDIADALADVLNVYSRVYVNIWSNKRRRRFIAYYDGERKFFSTRRACHQWFRHKQERAIMNEACKFLMDGMSLDVVEVSQPHPGAVSFGVTYRPPAPAGHVTIDLNAVAAAINVPVKLLAEELEEAHNAST